MGCQGSPCECCPLVAAFEREAVPLLCQLLPCREALLSWTTVSTSPSLSSRALGQPLKGGGWDKPSLCRGLGAHPYWWPVAGAEALQLRLARVQGAQTVH